MPLPWIKSSLLDDVDSWSFTNTANSAMAGLADMGSKLMAPVGQQVRQVVEQALPPPPVAQPVAPREVAPSVPTFSLGKVEDWITPTQPQREVQMPEAGPPPAAAAKGGGFSLPPLEAFIPSLAPKPAAGASPAPSPAPSARGAAPGPAPTGAIDNSSRSSFVASAWPHMLRAAGGNRDAAEMMLAAAISENGSVGTGKPFWANNFFGIKGAGPAGSVKADTWEQEGGQRVGQPATFAAYNTPIEGFRGFFDFLQKNPRYQGALQKYQQSGDAAALFHDVNAAGYATDPHWASTVENIRANQVAPITKALGDAPSASGDVGAADIPAAERKLAPPSAAQPSARQPTAGPAWGTYTPESLTPNQLNEGRAQGLSSEQALAICGPAAAVAFARANGRNPTLREAKDLAEASGVWDVSAGMHGPASEVALLEKMGIPAQLEQGADWGRIAQEVNAGRPVIVDTPGHYFTVNGAYPDGTFELGQSAGVLKASGGRTRYRPEEIPGLGMGAPRASIYARR